MKTLILTAAIALASLAAPSAQAGYCAPAPIYKTATCVVAKCNYQRCATDRCGNRYFYTVTVVTYRDTYSNGATRTYQQTLRS